MTYSEENNHNICQAIYHLRDVMDYTRFAGQTPDLLAAWELLRQAGEKLGQANIAAADQLARVNNPKEFA